MYTNYNIIERRESANNNIGKYILRNSYREILISKRRYRAI